MKRKELLVQPTVNSPEGDKYDTIEEVFKLTGKLLPSVYRKYDELEFKAYRNGNIRESGSCFKTVSWFQKWSDSWKRAVCSPIRGRKKKGEKSNDGKKKRRVYALTFV